MDVCKKFGSRIKNLRKANNISQEVLASLSDLDRSYMSSIERGERNVSIITIHKLATAFNLSIESLMKGL